MDLVGGDRLALPAPAQDDAPVGLLVHDRPRRGGAQRRVVDRLLGVGAQVEHVVALVAEGGDDDRLEPVPGVVGGDGDLHTGMLAGPGRPR